MKTQKKDATEMFQCCDRLVAASTVLKAWRTSLHEQAGVSLRSSTTDEGRRKDLKKKKKKPLRQDSPIVLVFVPMLSAETYYFLSLKKDFHHRLQVGHRKIFSNYIHGSPLCQQKLHKE